MDLVAATILALVQGLTEFLPISSSAHLILAPRLFGWTDQGLAFDVAVHLGTLIAVLWFFHDEIAAIARAWLDAARGREYDRREARLGLAIVIASLPVIVAGLLFEDLIATRLRSPLVIAATTGVFGVLLWVADLHKKEMHDEHQLHLGTALLIGIAQALALIPGTSRSGITITAGLALGLSRSAAARFSFLLAIPAIAGASLFETIEVVGSSVPVDWTSITVAVVVAAVSAYVCIRLFLGAIDRIGMVPFMLYRLALSAFLFWVFW
ncbi:MAG: undecaprenyl-diphosphate phosphatase [Gammaproteobacteria bacterium]